MTSTDQFIKLVAEMREAQREFFDKRTQGNLARAKQAAQKVDEWLLKYTAEQVQLEMWTRSSVVRHAQFCASRGQGGGVCDCQPMTSEDAGAYNPVHEVEAEEAKAA